MATLAGCRLKPPIRSRWSTMKFSDWKKNVTSADQKQFVALTQQLNRPFLTVKDPGMSDQVALALNKEYAAMPKDFIGVADAKTEIDSIRFQMRQARLQTLIDSVGQSKNRNALPTLRAMPEHKGAPRYFAAMAIGHFDDPSDIEDFIRRIERDPKSHFNMNSFGPAAADPILREIDNPAVSDSAKGVLASGLRSMVRRENLPKFRQLLKHKNQVVREMVADGICLAVQPGDEDLVIEIARDPSNMNQLQAYRAMNRMWSERFIPVLRDVLAGDPDPIVRATAAKTLGTVDRQRPLGLPKNSW